jgi:hypothetical protein
MQVNSETLAPVLLKESTPTTLRAAESNKKIKTPFAYALDAIHYSLALRHPLKQTASNLYRQIKPSTYKNFMQELEESSTELHLRSIDKFIETKAYELQGDFYKATPDRQAVMADSILDFIDDIAKQHPNSLKSAIRALAKFIPEHNAYRHVAELCSRMNERLRPDERKDLIAPIVDRSSSDAIGHAVLLSLIENLTAKMTPSQMQLHQLGISAQYRNGDRLNALGKKAADLRSELPWVESQMLKVFAFQLPSDHGDTNGELRAALKKRGGAYFSNIDKAKADAHPFAAEALSTYLKARAADPSQAKAAFKVYDASNMYPIDRLSRYVRYAPDVVSVLRDNSVDFTPSPTQIDLGLRLAMELHRPVTRMITA